MIKKIFLLSLLGIILSNTYAEQLPDNDTISVHVNNNRDHGVYALPVSGAKAYSLPMINQFKGNPGCYIACYTSKKEQGVYRVSDSSYAVGLIRIPGEYDKMSRKCMPDQQGNSANGADYANQAELCADGFPAVCGNSSECNAGVDTGGFFSEKLNTALAGEWCTIEDPYSITINNKGLTDNLKPNDICININLTFDSVHSGVGKASFQQVGKRSIPMLVTINRFQDNVHVLLSSIRSNNSIALTLDKNSILSGNYTFKTGVLLPHTVSGFLSLARQDDSKAGPIKN